jgi:hypothetical protein
MYQLRINKLGFVGDFKTQQDAQEYYRKHNDATWQEVDMYRNHGFLFVIK